MAARNLIAAGVGTHWIPAFAGITGLVNDYVVQRKNASVTGTSGLTLAAAVAKDIAGALEQGARKRWHLGRGHLARGFQRADPVQQLAGGRGLLKAALPEFVDQSDKMTHRTPKTIESPNDEGVAQSQDLQTLTEPWTIIFGSRQLVGEDEVVGDAVFLQRVELKAQVLVIRADAGVSDKSPVVRRRVHGLIFRCESMMYICLP